MLWNNKIHCCLLIPDSEWPFQSIASTSCVQDEPLYSTQVRDVKVLVNFLLMQPRILVKTSLMNNTVLCKCSDETKLFNLPDPEDCTYCWWRVGDHDISLWQRLCICWFFGCIIWTQESIMAGVWRQNHEYAVSYVWGHCRRWKLVKRNYDCRQRRNCSLYQQTPVLLSL